MTILEDLLEITAGTKLSGNEWSGFEVQPSGRFSFTPHEKHAFWGAISRAVRTPTRLEHESDLPIAFLPAGSRQPVWCELRMNLAFPSYYVLGGNTGMDSEELLSYELGYRADLLSDLRLDVALFYNRVRPTPVRAASTRSPAIHGRSHLQLRSARGHQRTGGHYLRVRGRVVVPAAGLVELPRVPTPTWSWIWRPTGAPIPTSSIPPRTARGRSPARFRSAEPPRLAVRLRAGGRARPGFLAR